MKRLLLTIVAATLIAPAAYAQDGFAGQKKPFTLPDLPYAADSLQSFINKDTMEIHYGRHHKGYVDKLNGFDLPADATLEALLKDISKYETGVRNNAGGHWNHSFFWQALTPDAEKNKLPEEFSTVLSEQFGSVDAFKAEFEKGAAGLFGSGWVWLIVDGDGKLVITTTPNQDNPLMDVTDKKGAPILGLDVWEHAYYLQYQNKRPDYAKNFWGVVNWDFVTQNYKAATAE